MRTPARFGIALVALIVVGCTSVSGDGVPGDDDDDALPVDCLASTAAPPPVPAGAGHVTFALNDARLYRVEARAGAPLEELSARLDDVAGAGLDAWVNSSPDGAWLALGSERGGAECAGFACLSVAPWDLSRAEVVCAAGVPLHPDGPSAIASSGALVVFPAEGPPHARDLFAVEREGTGWGAPRLLTGASPFDFNVQPAISADGASVVFDCGDLPFADEGNRVCEVATDGSGLQVVISPDDAPAGLSPGGALHHPDFTADGRVVFEGTWGGGEELWLVAGAGAEPTLLAAGFPDDNSPCVLPDGRVASLWLGRPGGPSTHELKILAGDGSGAPLVFEELDVLDVGLGCGR